MLVIKRSSESQLYDRSKLHASLVAHSDSLDHSFVNISELTSKIEKGICDSITTKELNDFVAETAASCSSIHPDFDKLAARIALSRLHRDANFKFSEKIEILFRNTKFLRESFYEFVKINSKEIDLMIDYSRDQLISYFGIKTLERSYLHSVNDVIIESPQDMFMRVSLEIHQTNILAANETYDLMSQKYFVHATPTLFNSGAIRPQLSSCFLLTIKEDSADGIFRTLNQCSSIAKYAGGIGINASHIRARGSPLSTGGCSNGLIAMIKVYEAMSRFISQCGNKRVSSIAFFLEPWHPEIFDFLDLRKNTGKEELRSRSIFTALWMPDLFMKRVEKNESWSLFCPNIAKGLNDVYGDEFEELYCKYESENLAWKTISAQKLWEEIVKAQIETGTPYIVYKDAANRKNNQKNLGIIKCSNLCAEILEFTSADEVAVCNLASIALPSFVKNGVFDFDMLGKITRVITRNLNRIIDVNYYPVEEASYSNKKHRPIGIGIQGLADVFALLRIPFDSSEARKLNREIFEAIYFHSLEASSQLAEIEGPYSSFEGSPISQGILQFHMWNVTPSKNHDWDKLIEKIKKHGVRNSLLVALMPTASTSQILGFNECFEPFTSNIYTRRTLAGEFQLINKYLLEDLINLDLWSTEMKNLIIDREGSIQQITTIPKNIRELYKTVWEISMKSVIDMAADRAAFVDQTQSMKIFMAIPKYSQMTSMHFYAWRKGLKTGIYYLRTQPVSGTIKFTVDREMVRKSENEMNSCSLDDPTCMSCSG